MQEGSGSCPIDAVGWFALPATSDPHLTGVGCPRTLPGQWLPGSFSREQAEQDLGFGVKSSCLLGPTQGAVLLCGPLSVRHLGQHYLENLLVMQLSSRHVARSEALLAADDVARILWNVSVGHTDRSSIVNGPER